MRNLYPYFREMVMAVSRSPTTAMRPNKNRTTPSYFGSASTSSDATATNPAYRSSPGSFRVFPFTEVSGRKVARPAFCSDKSRMPAFAAASSSTTMFWSAPPSAVSTATEYSGFTLKSWVTVPKTPRMAPFFAARITALTL